MVKVSVINSVISIPYSIIAKASAKSPVHVKLSASGPLFLPHPSACPATSPEYVYPAETDIEPEYPELYFFPLIFAHPFSILKSRVALPELTLHEDASVAQSMCEENY